MECKVYTFTAQDEGVHGTYTFVAWQLPTGEVCVPEVQTHDTFYDDLASVEAHGLAFVIDYAPTGETIDVADADLQASIRGSAREFGAEAIPARLQHYLAV